jgi:hypothetical protein
MIFCYIFLHPAAAPAQANVHGRGAFMSIANGTKVGDWVEVKPLTEILPTLDETGALDALPFMPEMAPFAGKRFRVVKSAHKTCDPTGSSDMRRMPDAVHLETRCDGSAHDGCEARCLLFWKHAWLRPVDGPGVAAAPAEEQVDLSALHAATRTTSEAGKVRYRCQTTEIVPATTLLPTSDLGQYADDVSTGNVPLGKLVVEMTRVYGRAIVGKAAKLVGIGRRSADGSKHAPEQGDSDQLNLQPGELVEVRPAEEILAMLDEERKHRGMSVELEMLRHCGRTYRVAARVKRIIDEKTGRMIKFANECIALEGVICSGLDNRRRLFCPRGPLYYWREAWLRRVDEGSIGPTS